MSEINTPTIFDLFQNEYELFETCSVKNMNIQTPIIDYIVVMEMDLGEWKVSFDLEKNSICCSSCKFEKFEILCGKLKGCAAFERSDLKLCNCVKH